MLKNSIKEFSVMQVPLEGVNLVEASAGTGKTYSLAILALRLILEKNVPIQEILMVTYTKSAVAELEQRLRLFVREALKVASGEKIEDQTISALVENAIAAEGTERICIIMQDAVLFLDETSILTIHSFCQQVLHEFSFETGSLFGATLTTSLQDIIERELQQFWRKNITTLPDNLLRVIGAPSMKNFREIVNKSLSGKPLHSFSADENYELNQQKIEGWGKTIQDSETLLQQKEEDFCNLYKADQQKFTEAVNTHGVAKKTFSKLMDNPMDVLDQLCKNPSVNYAAKIFPDLLPLLPEIVLLRNSTEVIRNEISDMLQHYALQTVVPSVMQAKRVLNLLSYDDLILQVHDSLVKKHNPILVDLLQKKYKAVFVDEFQDTDKLQYEIFKTAFGTNTIVFYIGDPKQSIYGFRSADVHTYLEAKMHVDHVYGMNVNFRSNELYTKGMNIFFQPHDSFDAFHFPGNDGIKYIPVEATETRTHGSLQKDGHPVAPVILAELGKKDEIVESVAATCLALLTTDYTITKNDDSRPVKPSDIGILVSTGKNGFAINRALAEVGIPSIVVGQDKIFESAEANIILYFIEAMLERNRSSINKAMYNDLTGFTAEEITLLDHDILVPLFTNYSETWLQQGIYVVLQNFLNDFGIREKLASRGDSSGDRSLTNLQQLSELLYKTERLDRLTPTDLLLWLRRAIDERSDDDAYIQRIEREDEAVKIVTVHKSKGLEYNIILLPNLDYLQLRNIEYTDYRDPDIGRYVTIHKKDLSSDKKQLHDDQKEQEFRRLIYVAVTRAVYSGFIFTANNSYYKNSSLKTFLSALPKSDVIQFQNIVKDTAAQPFQQNGNGIIFNPDPIIHPLSNIKWYRVSYSGLAAEKVHLPKPKINFYTDEYDKFIFSTLPHGSDTGYMLHYIFENLDFVTSEKQVKTIEQALKLYSPGESLESVNDYLQLCAQVLTAKIKVGENIVNLSSLGFRDRLHELEFHFPFSDFDTKRFMELLHKNNMSSYLKPFTNVEGMMNGLVDMVFIQNEKYYILDWKSTYLGPQVQNYSAEDVAAAMEDHNYHAQYCIYLVAIKRYLENRLPHFNFSRDFGGVIYCFVRGMRSGMEEGVYTFQPTSQFMDELEQIFTGSNVES